MWTFYVAKWVVGKTINLWGYYREYIKWCVSHPQPKLGDLLFVGLNTDLCRYTACEVQNYLTTAKTVDRQRVPSQIKWSVEPTGRQRKVLAIYLTAQGILVSGTHTQSLLQASLSPPSVYRRILLNWVRHFNWDSLGEALGNGQPSDSPFTSRCFAMVIEPQWTFNTFVGLLLSMTIEYWC
jgi:hypothetical protein